MKKILVIGSSVCDVIIRVHHIPRPEEDENIISQTLSIGGCAYNIASMLRYLQVPHTLFSPIGTGIYGDFVREQFLHNHIPLLLIAKQKNGCCYCLVDDSGERTFLCEHGAEYLFKKEWFDSLNVNDYDCVYICGLEIEEKSGDIIIDFLSHNPHLQIYFAPGPRINHISQKKLQKLFDLHPIIHLNLSEILSYTQQNSLIKAVNDLYSQIQQSLIVTLGDKGCYYFDGKQDITVPSMKAEVVDTIGAGDAHMGAFIAFQTLGYSVKESLQKANQHAAKVVQQQGATLQKNHHQ